MFYSLWPQGGSYNNLPSHQYSIQLFLFFKFYFFFMIIHYKFYSIHICTVWINYKTNTYVPVPITQLQKQIISEWQNPPCSPPQSHLLPLPEVTSVIFHALLFCMVLQHITASIYCKILHVVQLYINIFFHDFFFFLIIFGCVGSSFLCEGFL